MKSARETSAGLGVSSFSAAISGHLARSAPLHKHSTALKPAALLILGAHVWVACVSTQLVGSGWVATVARLFTI